MDTSKNLFLSLALLPLATVAPERYMTRTGHIAFHSETPIANIHPYNREVSRL